MRMDLHGKSRECLDFSYKVFDCLRKGASHRIHHSYRIRRRLAHQSRQEVRQVFLARAGRIVGEIDGVQIPFLRIIDAVDTLAKHILPGPFELIFQFGITDRYFDDDPVRAAFHGFVDIDRHGPRKGIDLGLKTEPGDLLDRRKILIRYGRHPGLDALDACLIQHPCYPDLIVLAENHPGGLFAVPQRGVVNFDLCGNFQSTSHLIDEVIRADPPHLLLNMPIFHGDSSFSFQ
ncbi:MAG: hypothetical protein ACD_87C00311G0001 [uncultured bacterium]|nr:MAG: hypothetical protein ACD_87C00311G0001 [uncultured bacterium]